MDEDGFALSNDSIEDDKADETNDEAAANAAFVPDHDFGAGGQDGVDDDADDQRDHDDDGVRTVNSPFQRRASSVASRHSSAASSPSPRGRRDSSDRSGLRKLRLSHAHDKASAKSRRASGDAAKRSSHMLHAPARSPIPAIRVVSPIRTPVRAPRNSLAVSYRISITVRCCSRFVASHRAAGDPSSLILPL